MALVAREADESVHYGCLWPRKLLDFFDSLIDGCNEGETERSSGYQPFHSALGVGSSAI